MSKPLSTGAILGRLVRTIPRLQEHHLRHVLDLRFPDDVHRCGPYRVVDESLLPQIAAACVAYLKALPPSSKKCLRKPVTA
jgi:hypothetical protein